MRKIVPHLWFDKAAKEAAEFYVSAFPDSRVLSAKTIHDTPSGDTEIVSFELAGQPFMSISAGPLFKFNPSVSFIVNFDPSRDPDAAASLDRLWAMLSAGGQTLMPLQEYPFSKLYGWCNDRYGVSWQLMLSKPGGEPRPFIMPSLMFTGAVAGKAEEAAAFYRSVFEDSSAGVMARRPADMGPDKAGTVLFSDFMLRGQWFAAMDSAFPHGFGFNEAISFIVRCETQEEVDRYWAALSAVPAAEQCGWLKDKYGLSWQIVPTAMDEMMKNGSREQVERVTQAFLKMKKFDIAELRRAYENR